MADRQRGDRRRVDAARQERADRHVGAHVLRHRIREHVRDLVVALLPCGVGDRTHTELRREVAADRQRAAGGGGGVAPPDSSRRIDAWMVSGSGTYCSTV